MNLPTRVAFQEDSMDAATWADALLRAAEIGAKAVPPVRDYILLTHTKQQLSLTSLAGALGTPTAQALIAGKAVPLSGSAQLRHATLQTLKGTARGGVVVACYADGRMMDTLDGLDGLVGVVAVPDMPDDVADWIERWKPTVPGRQASAATSLIDDPVVGKALHELSGWVNLSHPIMSPRDKEHCNETLRILRANGHALPTGKMKSWAIQNGWKPGAAEELAALAGRIGTLKGKPPLGAFHDPKGKYERWRT